MKITILFLGKSGGTCIYINRSLYQPGNKRDLINKIMDLYKDRKKCLSIAENNVKTAEKYSLKHAVKKWPEFIQAFSPPIDALPPLPL